MPGRVVPKVWDSNPVIYAPARFKRACRYDAFIPDALHSLNIELPAATAGVVSEAEAAIRELNTTSASGALAPLARLLLRTESIASSKIEGLQLGVRELARAEARTSAGRHRSRTAIEVMANIEAMQVAVTEASMTPRFGEPELLSIHHRLMEADARSGIAGRLRSGQNWIGGNDYNPCGADFVPPPVEALPHLLEDLYAEVNDDLKPPIVQAALVHAQFETIHPFDDGNGRTGRALIHVILRRRGVAPNYVPPISVVLAASRDRYIAGLTRFRGDGVVEWIEQFAAAAAHSARLARTYLARVEALRATWRRQLADTSSPRSDAAAWAVIDVLPSYPIITGPIATASTDRSKGPVYDALAQLTKAGVLMPLSTSKRNRSWEAAGLLDLLEALEAGEM